MRSPVDSVGSLTWSPPFGPVRIGLALVVLGWLGACAAERPERRPSPPPAAGIFVDRAAELNLDFVHFNGMTGDFLYPEMMGAGGAVLDYDGDGDLDLYLVQGARLGSGDPLFPPRHPETLSDRLYRSDFGPSGSGELSWRFVDRTEHMGARSEGYGMGVAVGDYDGDAWPDLYVTNLGPNTLLRNRGDGTFTDVTRASGSGDSGWGVPAVFVDYDRDGRLDLFVGNYLEYSVAGDRACFGTTGARDYCGPNAYPGASDRLYRNLGDGRFADVSRDAGVARPGRTLGAIADDLDGDGWPELYVGNDGEPNYLWLNRGGRFEEGAVAAGVAVDGEGRPQASMGIDAADFDNDGDDDLLLTHLSGESNTLYRNEGGGRFVDVSRTAGLAAPSLAATGFGVAWLDYDGDGWLDALSVNGAVRRLEAQSRVSDPYPLKQRKQLMRNRGDGRLEEVTDRAGEAFTRLTVGRGAAVGDLDNDGDPDLLVVNNNGPAELLINRAAATSEWVGLVPPGAGFRARLSGAEGHCSGRGRTDGSYASARDPRIVLRLAGGAASVDLHLDGPGRRVVLRSVPRGRYLVIQP